MQRRARRKLWLHACALSACALSTLSAVGCVTPVKPPPLPPSASGSASANSVTPASYTLPDGTKVHDVKCSCCQH